MLAIMTKGTKEELKVQRKMLTALLKDIEEELKIQRNGYTIDN